MIPQHNASEVTEGFRAPLGMGTRRGDLVLAQGSTQRGHLGEPKTTPRWQFPAGGLQGKVPHGIGVVPREIPEKGWGRRAAEGKPPRCSGEAAPGSP